MDGEVLFHFVVSRFHFRFHENWRRTSFHIGIIPVLFDIAILGLEFSYYPYGVSWFRKFERLD